MVLEVLMTGWGYPPDIDGGLDIHVARLFETLSGREDIDIELLMPAERAPDDEKVHPVETDSEEMVRKARELSLKAVELSREFDIIHTHDWLGAEPGYKAAKHSEVSWISTMHSLADDRTRKGSRRLEKLERAAVEAPDEVIAVSDILASGIQEKYDRRPEVVHNGFSRPKYSGKDVKSDLGISDDIVLFVGRHSEQKGIEHLVYGFSKLLESGREAHLVIGGKGHMTESLKMFTEVLGIQQKVTFTGFIPREQLGDFYSEAEVFVSPSLSEPFGLTITEALNAGTKVVATESGVEEVLPEDTITSIEPESGSIALGLEKALDSGDEPDPEPRSWEEMSEEVTQLYRDLSR